MAAPPYPVEQHVELGAQPHRHRLGAHQRPRFGVEIGAAAGRQDVRRPVQQALDDAALAGAELGLAEAVEELRDGAARGTLDFVVGVDERQAEPEGQALDDRALADPHQPDEGDGARRRKRR